MRYVISAITKLSLEMEEVLTYLKLASAMELEDEEKSDPILGDVSF